MAGITSINFGSLRDFDLRLLMTVTVTGDRSQVEVAGVQAGDSWTEVVIAYRLTDVELVDLHSVRFVSPHRMSGFPYRPIVGLCHPEARRTWCVGGDRLPLHLHLFLCWMSLLADNYQW
jgi:hypothetical protein